MSEHYDGEMHRRDLNAVRYDRVQEAINSAYKDWCKTNAESLQEMLEELKGTVTNAALEADETAQLDDYENPAEWFGDVMAIIREDAK